MYLKRNLIKNLLLYSFTFVSLSLFSQSSIGFKVTGPSFHLAKWNQDPSMFENRITKDGTFIMEPGYQINFQKFIYLTTLSIEAKQGIHADAASKMAGHFSLGLRWKFFHSSRNSLSISFAPTYAFRENWNEIPKYVDHNLYTDNGKYQYKFLINSELSYNIYIGKKSDISFSLMYNNSYQALTFGLGYRYWINPYANVRDDGCKSCGKKWSKGKFKKRWRRIWR